MVRVVLAQICTLLSRSGPLLASTYACVMTASLAITIEVLVEVVKALSTGYTNTWTTDILFVVSVCSDVVVNCVNNTKTPKHIYDAFYFVIFK